MKKIISSLITVVTLFGIGQAFAKAAELPEPALYISSDSADKYNKYQTVIDEYFKEIDAYRTLSDFTISGNYTFSEKGLELQNDSKVVVNEEVSGEYIINTAITTENGNADILWSITDDTNYEYLKLENSKMSLISVTDGKETVLASSETDEFSAKLVEIKIEVLGDKINIYKKSDNTEKKVFEDVSIFKSGKKTGIRFSDGGALKLLQVWKKNPDTFNGSIDYCVVSYENLGECTVVMAAFDNGRLDSLYTTKADIKNTGNNYFSFNVNNTHSIQGLERKYFIFDSLNNLVPMVKEESISSYKNGALSDELEPYYQHTTAQSRTTTDMIKRIRGGKKPGDELLDENLTADELSGGERYKVVDMYKKAGIDLSLDLENYSISSILKNSMPQKFSHLTPKSLTGTFEQPYSVDAPWNNKIPEDNPSMLLDSWNNMTMTMQIGTVKNEINSDGNGIGIPIVIGEVSDPYYTLLCKYNTNISGLHGHLIKAPENVAQYTNHHTTSDNHAVFINGETKTSIQTMGIRPPGYTGGYSINNGLVLNYDARATSTSGEIDLSGIANEGMTGTNAVSMPMEGFMIKSSELKDGGEINHAIAGAIGNMMKARVYPALSYDSWVRNATTTDNLTGNVPYGAIVRLSSDLPLEELFKNGKLSSPAYKLLKAWRDYGFYNIDCSGSSQNKIVLYTSTENSDWNYTVPYSGNSGISAVTSEINAFLANADYFGLEQQPLYYLTVPVVKYTELDVTLDGYVDEADYTEIEKAVGVKPELENSRFDVNKDGIIDQKDLDILTNFLNGTAYHADGDYTVTASYTSGGTLWVDDKTPKHGQWVSIAASPYNGYRFVGWEGAFKDETKNVIHVKADRNITVKAIYEKLDNCKFNLTTEGNGTVKGSTTKASYTLTVKEEYGKNTQMAFKATPDEGWQFDHWEYQGTKVYSDVLDVVILDDTDVKVVFRQPYLLEEFTDSESFTTNWEGYSSGVNTTSDYSLTSGMLKFKDWDEKLATVTNKNISLAENESFELITKGRITATGGGNQGMVLFGYQSEKDFYSLEFDINMVFKLKKVTDGKTTVLKTFEINPLINIYEWMTFKVMYSPENGLNIVLYQKLNEYALVENYELDGSVAGKIGLGSRHCGAVGFDNFILYKESGSNG